MRLCLLGGTAFLGRRIALAAPERGHTVTCVARGSAPPPDGVELVAADRDDDAALAALAGRSWDAVLDLTRQPGQARRAVRDLPVAHRVLVSTLNVYARFDTPEQNEEAALLDPLAGESMAGEQDYGPAKVACERAYRDDGPAGDATVTIARVGLIGGDGDTSGRSGYWPWRFAHPVGDGVVVPDDAAFPCALVDVADLAAWLLRAAEAGLDGTFNVTGPTVPLGEVLRTAAAVAGASVPVVPVPVADLAAAGVRPWAGPDSLPLWIGDPDWRHVATLDTARARAAGLVTRPLADTLAAALEFEERRGGPPAAGPVDRDRADAAGPSPLIGLRVVARPADHQEEGPGSTSGRRPWPGGVVQVPEQRAGEPLEVLMVCSSGGHLAQLVALEPWSRQHRRRWVCFDTPDATSILRDEDVVWAHHPTTRHLPNLLRNLALAWRELRRRRPDVVISTGAGVAVPFFVLARLLRVPTVYLEVYDRIDSPTLTARLCRPFTDAMLVQWDEQRSLYRDTEVVGCVL